MREIKFRAWSVISGKMLSHEYLLEHGYNALVNNDYQMMYWMQYTGLKDKNGKEIYEGDILRFKDWKPKEVVYMDKDFSGFSLKGTDLWLMQYDMRDSEVIGNIHENPELLKVTP